MTTFSSKHDTDYEEYDTDVSMGGGVSGNGGGSVSGNAGGSVGAICGSTDRSEAPSRAAYNPPPEDAYAAAASGYESAYVNALCAELSNMMQYNDANRKDPVLGLWNSDFATVIVGLWESGTNFFFVFSSLVGRAL